jgi:hypothetical protein
MESHLSFLRNLSPKESEQISHFFYYCPWQAHQRPKIIVYSDAEKQRMEYILKEITQYNIDLLSCKNDSPVSVFSRVIRNLPYVTTNNWITETYAYVDGDVVLEAKKLPLS